MKTWSSKWVRRGQPRKQRAFLARAPQHVRSAMVVSHLSKQLREKLKRRGIRVRPGDSGTVLRGRFRKITGKVESVDIARQRVYVSGMTIAKKDGSSVKVPVRASALVVT